MSQRNREQRGDKDEQYLELIVEIWNDIQEQARKIIRESHPLRTLLIGTGYGNQIDFLKDLRLPEDDRNIIVVQLAEYGDIREVSDDGHTRYRETFQSMRLSDRVAAKDQHGGSIIGHADTKSFRDKPNPTVDLHIADTTAGRDLMALVRNRLGLADAVSGRARFPMAPTCQSILSRAVNTRAPLADVLAGRVAAEGVPHVPDGRRPLRRAQQVPDAASFRMAVSSSPTALGLAQPTERRSATAPASSQRSHSPRTRST